MNRHEILSTADDLISNDRNRDYGGARENFRRIAEYWSTHLGVPVTAKDVGIMMALLKIARMHTTNKADNYVDADGYLALTGELDTEDES